MSILKKEHHELIYFLAICLLAASIPLSRYFMSVAQLILFGNWILEGHLRNKFRLFFRNKAALVFSSLFLLHVTGLFFTTDFDYAIKDLRTKLPLLLLPLFFSTSNQLNSRKIQIIFNTYLSAVFIGTIAGIYILLHQAVPDTRDMSPFISHIRFSLNVCFAIVILLYNLDLQTKEVFMGNKLLYIVLLLWFLLYLYVSQSFTGYFVLTGLVLAWLVALSRQIENRVLKAFLFLTVLLLPVLAFYYLRGEYKQFFGSGTQQPAVPDRYTPDGNLYSHDSLNTDVVNGHRLWLYVCRDEIKQAWEERSEIKFDSLGNTGLKISDVLIRYLTSKGARKDASSVKQLTEREVQYIESGIADIEETRGSPMHKRLRKVFWEYQNFLSTGDPSGHSVMMRFVYWKTSLGIIKEHPLTGVGTGDMNEAFDRFYQDHHSKLQAEWRRRSHNQFLSVGVGFGIIGFLWFVFALFFPPVYLRKMSSFLFGSFFLILVLSMLAEDTIESQDGVTFAAFFYCFLLFVNKPKSP